MGTASPIGSDWHLAVSLGTWEDQSPPSRIKLGEPSGVDALLALAAQLHVRLSAPAETTLAR